MICILCESSGTLFLINNELYNFELYYMLCTSSHKNVLPVIKTIVEQNLVLSIYKFDIITQKIAFKNNVE
jgi:hypothetical protein